MSTKYKKKSATEVAAQRKAAGARNLLREAKRLQTDRVTKQKDKTRIAAVRKNKVVTFSLRPRTVARLNAIAERRGQSGEFCSKSSIIDELVRREARKHKGIE